MLFCKINKINKQNKRDDGNQRWAVAESEGFKVEKRKPEAKIWDLLLVLERVVMKNLANNTIC